MGDEGGKRGAGEHLRPFHAVDLASLHSMICHTIDVSYSDVYPVRAVQFFKEYHSEKRIMERNETGEVLIMENDGTIVATGALVGNEIQGVFVRPDCQGRGYGKILMAELEKRAKAREIRKIELSISLPSRKFYETLGYEVLAERSEDVGEGQYLNYWPGEKALL
ncbi:MAG TPA: GNAT family N-acetyltransferase [Syntrophales bacterium]|nr:GNAT family N-acetyltransferase [Syntrophales bacterium]HPQ45122.1 GNAT family N-acetyltransferase [Syntrophales bacterium]